MTDFRKAFPDLYFWGTADLIAEDDYVVGQWEGGGTHSETPLKHDEVRTALNRIKRDVHRTNEVFDGIRALS